MILDNINLSNSNLRNAQLRNVSLKNSNLRNSNLDFAYLKNIKINNTDLCYCSMTRTEVDIRWLEELSNFPMTDFERRFCIQSIIKSTGYNEHMLYQTKAINNDVLDLSLIHI